MSYFTILGSKYVGRGDYEQQVYNDFTEQDSEAEIAVKKLERYQVPFSEDIQVKEKQEGMVYGPWPDGSFVLEFTDDMGNKEMYSSYSLDGIKDLYFDINFKPTESPLVDNPVDVNTQEAITLPITNKIALNKLSDTLESKTTIPQENVVEENIFSQNAMEINEELKEAYDKNPLGVELKNFFYLAVTKLLSGFEYKPHVPAMMFERITTENGMLSVLRPLSFLSKKRKNKELTNEKWKFDLPIGTLVGHGTVIDTFLKKDMKPKIGELLVNSGSRKPLSIHTNEPEEEIGKKEKNKNTFIKQIKEEKHKSEDWNNVGGGLFHLKESKRIFAIEHPNFISVFVTLGSFQQPLHLDDFETLPPKEEVMWALKD